MNILGHAGYNTNGPDIVCAAVSTLSGTLVQCLNEINEEQELWLYEAAVSPGCVKIEVEPKGNAIEKVNVLFESIMTGYLLLEKQYNDYVHVIR